MWEYKIYRQFRVIHKIMRETSELEVSITDPPEDKHAAILAGLKAFEERSWMDSPNFTQNGFLAYFLAKEFVHLYDYYNGWRQNTFGFNLALSLTDCIRCLEEQKKHGLSRESDEEVYIDTLNLLRREYHKRTVLNQDTVNIVDQANAVFRDLRDRVVSLYAVNYPKAVKSLKVD